LFREVPGAILLKPISETFRRSVRDVFEEYAAYDLHVVWIYRDPVNATHSIGLFGFTERTVEAPELAEQWKQRNQSLLAAIPFYPERITIVRYEDLANSPALLLAIGRRVGIEAFPLFRADSGRGRREMAPEMQAMVDHVTRETRARLDAARLDAAQIVPPSTETFPAPSKGPDIYSPAFCTDPFDHFRNWREQGSVHRLRQPNSWLVLNYQDVAAALRDDRFSTAYYRNITRIFAGADPSGHARLRSLLNPHFTRELMRRHADRIERHTRRILNELAGGREFDLMPAFATRLTAELTTDSSLLDGVASDSRLTPGDVADFRRFIPVAGCVLSHFIGNAVHYLLFHTGVESGLRSRPANIPAFVDEILRLFPPAPTLRRLTLRPVAIGAATIPTEAHVYLAIGAANRDPAQYEEPDELILHRTGPPHLSFSVGPNGCLGRHLGQLECETAIRVLLTEFPRLRINCSTDQIQFAGTPWLYGPTALPVRFDA
jgi:cytochrome P450